MLKEVSIVIILVAMLLVKEIFIVKISKVFLKNNNEQLYKVAFLLLID